MDGRTSALPAGHQPGDKVTYSHAIDVLGVILSRIDDKPLLRSVRRTGAGSGGDARHRVLCDARSAITGGTMYRHDEHDQLRHDVMGPPHVKPPSSATPAVDCGRPPTTTCASCGCCWATAPRRRSGAVAGVGAPDAHRPADRRAEAPQFPGRAVLGRPRVRVQPVGRYRSGQVDPAVGPGGVGRSAGPARTGRGGRPIRART